jgi:23S rRNA pseudouridine1911/1915/1917 synthase
MIGQIVNKRVEFVSDSNIRVDKFLTTKLNESRNQIEKLISKGFVSVNGEVVTKSGYKLKDRENIEVILPKAEEKSKQDVDFDIPIIYEDDYILVLNKPSGLVVHDAPSLNEPTLVDWLVSKGVSLSTISADVRHGIVHRLDRGTSGAIVVAKTNEAHVNLSIQLQDKSMGRYYIAIIDNHLKDSITVEKPIGRNPSNRLKMDTINSGKYAKTAFLKVASSSKYEKYELIACKLFTGRTHQIRVHLNSIGRHIVGDSLYGFKGSLNRIDRICLHAYYIYLKHPITGQELGFVADLPKDLRELMC